MVSVVIVVVEVYIRVVRLIGIGLKVLWWIGRLC